MWSFQNSTLCSVASTFTSCRQHPLANIECCVQSYNSRQGENKQETVNSAGFTNNISSGHHVMIKGAPTAFSTKNNLKFGNTTTSFFSDFKRGWVSGIMCPLAAFLPWNASILTFLALALWHSLFSQKTLGVFSRSIFGGGVGLEPKT